MEITPKDHYLDKLREGTEEEIYNFRKFIAEVDIENPNKEAMLEYSQMVEALFEYDQTRGVDNIYPEEGPLRRELYVPHMKFFEAGAKQPIRAILAANRIGKSYGLGGCETTYHATGIYPKWWKGKRFNTPVKIWACGKKAEKTRDVNQKMLLGEINALGTGLIPKHLIGDCNKKSSGNIRDCVGEVYIKHISGGWSSIVFKSYSEERLAFEGEAVHLIWLDEEPPLPIYTECLLRTMTTEGHIICTFTPLDGMSDTVMRFLPNGKLPKDGNGLVIDNKFVIMATWDDAPHLTAQQKKIMWEEIPPYQRDARSKGIPQLGSGAIYPIQEEEIKIKDFPIPDWWKKIYGFDVGWKSNAAVWAAVDPQTNVAYLYSIYKRGMAEPAIHANAIKARGEWIPGAIDPASSGSSQIEGEKLLPMYQDLGLNVFTADNSREPGIMKVWMSLSSGHLKVFQSLEGWFEEFRVYRRDDKGNIVKKHDHLMDATRYLMMELEMASERPPNKEDVHDVFYDDINYATGY